MDLNALSKLASVSERKNEPGSTKAVTDSDFEATFLRDEVDEHDTDHPLQDSDQSDGPAKKNNTSGSDSRNDGSAKDAVKLENLSETTESETKGSEPPDDESLDSFALASGLPDDRTTLSSEPKNGTVGAGQLQNIDPVHGIGPAGHGHKTSGVQSPIGVPEIPLQAGAAAAPVGVELPTPNAQIKANLSAAVTATNGSPGKAGGDATNQLTDSAAAAQAIAKSAELALNNGEAQKPHAKATMSLLERRLGGHAVRLLPEDAQATMTAHEKTADRAYQIGGFIDTKTQSTTVHPQNGLTDLDKIQASQRQMTTVLNAELNSTAGHDHIPEEAGWDVRPGAILTSVAASTPISARPELAISISHQMAEAMRVAADKSVEIALSPAELGRVRMVLNASEAGVTLSILAERPETLDLMRRNIDDLAKSFADLGYEDISFSFEQNDQMTDDALEQSSDAHDILTDEADIPNSSVTPAVPRQHMVIAPDGVDIRI